MELSCSDEDFLNTNVGDLHLLVYEPLIEVLDLQNTWKSLVAILPAHIGSKMSVEKLEREGQKVSCSSSKLLLQQLSIVGVTVSNLIGWLENMNLQRALLLIKPDEPLQIIQQPYPKVEADESDKSVLKLQCLAVGFPTPSYQWMKDGADLHTQQDSELIISPVTPNETGIYKCRVSKHDRETNEEGFIFSDSTHVRVKPGSKINPSIQNFSIYPEEPVIVVQPVCPSQGKIAQGSYVLLRCEGRSRHEVKYQWYCNNEQLKGETSSELKLMGLYPSEGICKFHYQCLVFNEYGNYLSNMVDVELDAAHEGTQYFAEDKVALLIANEAYTNLEPLMQPASDVRTMSQLLTDMNYRVFAFVNLGLVEMRNAVELFCQHLRQGVYGVFFYAGHSFEQYGQNYLQPVDATKEYLLSECLCVQYILQCMQEKNPAHTNNPAIIMLDTCRSLPPENTWDNNIRAPGVIYHPKMNRNVLYIHSTSLECSAHDVLGQENGPFVSSLKKHIKDKKSIRDILLTVESEMELDPVVGHRQIPWTAGNARAVKFYDPVIGNDAVYKKLVDEWKSLAVIPSAREVKSNDLILRLEFNPHFGCFWNALDMKICIQKSPRSLQLLARFYNEEIVSAVKISQSAEIMIEIFNLQKIKEELRGFLLFKDPLNGSEYCRFPLELGFPLVSRKFLWQNSLNSGCSQNSTSSTTPTVNDLIDLS